MFEFNFNYLGKYYLDRLKNIDVEKASEKTLIKSVQQVVKYNNDKKYSRAYFKGVQDGMFGVTAHNKYMDIKDPITKLIYDSAYKFVSKKFENK
jgi:hypothetical protein